MWKASVEDPGKFYSAMAEELHWQTKFTEVGPKECHRERALVIVL